MIISNSMSLARVDFGSLEVGKVGIKSSWMQSFASVLLLITNFVGGSTRLSPRGSTATLSITGQTHEKLTSICFFTIRK